MAKIQSPLKKLRIELDLSRSELASIVFYDRTTKTDKAELAQDIALCEAGLCQPDSSSLKYLFKLLAQRGYETLRTEQRTWISEQKSQRKCAVEIEANGEYFDSRGIGLETIGCFVCGAESATRANIAGFVKSKEAGKRIVSMFSQKVGAYLDLRPHEPTWIQVKIGACTKHRTNLKKLNDAVADNRITQEHVKSAEKYANR